MTARSSFPVELAELRAHARLLASELPGPLRRVTVRSGGLSIEVEWQPETFTGTSNEAGGPAHGAVPSPTQAQVPEQPQVPASGPATEGQLEISSPMVGTFYSAPGPDSAPFVEVGDLVMPGQTIALIEAMKLFNPITAEHPGIVAAVLARSGQPVEFGQPLLLIAVAEPSDAGVTRKE